MDCLTPYSPLRFGEGPGERFLRFTRQLIKAGEHLVATIGVGLLPPRQQAIGSEDPQLAQVALERATAGAVRAEVRPVEEECVGSQIKDIVEASSEVFTELQQGAD